MESNWMKEPPVVLSLIMEAPLSLCFLLVENFPMVWTGLKGKIMQLTASPHRAQITQHTAEGIVCIHTKNHPSGDNKYYFTKETEL